jgi:hypothetical protein
MLACQTVRMNRSHYELLEIPRDATPSDIAQAYRALLNVWDPDRFEGSLRERAERRSAELHHAFETLRDAERRQVYDAKLFGKRSGTTAPVAYRANDSAAMKAGFTCGATIPSAAAEAGDEVLALEPHSRPLGLWGKVVVVALLLVAAADVFAINAALWQNDLIEGDPSESQLVHSDSLISWSGMAQFGMLVIAAAVFIYWFRRAYRSTSCFAGARLRYSSKMAVGGWFIPFASLWIPIQIVNDVSRSIDMNDSNMSEEAWDRAPIPAVIPNWWIAYVISNIVGWQAFRRSLVDLSDMSREQAIAAVQEYNDFNVFASSVDLVAAILAMAVVWNITRRHDRRVASASLS